MGRIIYKVLRGEEWAAVKRGAPIEAPVDREDGYVHLSTAETLQGTLSKWFRGAEDAVLLAFDADDFGSELRWEPSRGGELFPHVYGLISLKKVRQTWRLRMGDDGAPGSPLEYEERSPV